MVDAFAPAALCRVYSRLQLMAVELQPTLPRSAGGDPTFRRPRAGSGAALYAGLAVDYHPPAPSRPLRPANGRRAHPAGGLSAAVGFLCQRGVIRRRPTRRKLAAVNAGGWFCHAAHPRPDAVSARSQDLIPLFAEESTLGAHYGALATAGGCAVLAGNLLLGHLLDQALIPSPQAVYPLASAGAVSAVQRRRPAGDLSPAGGNDDAERVTARSGSEQLVSIFSANPLTKILSPV